MQQLRSRVFCKVGAEADAAFMRGFRDVVMKNSKGIEAGASRAAMLLRQVKR